MNPFTLHRQPSDVRRELAGRMRLLRKQAGYTQEDFAQRSGVSLGSLKRFERTGQISLESLLKLAHLLGRLPDFDRIFAPPPHEGLEGLFSDFTQ
jgi:transcriptional regulator with XRE-family HTH domain